MSATIALPKRKSKVESNDMLDEIKEMENPTL